MFNKLRASILAEEEKAIEKEAFHEIIQEAGDFDEDIEDLMGIDDDDCEDVDIEAVPADKDLEPESIEEIDKQTKKIASDIGASTDDADDENVTADDLLEEGASILDQF